MLQTRNLSAHTRVSLVNVLNDGLALRQQLAFLGDECRHLLCGIYLEILVLVLKWHSWSS